MKARVLIGLCALAAIACNEEEPPLQPGSFDRPTRVAFACFDITDDENPQPLALADCEPAAIQESLSSTGRPTRSLHALVVQSARGEVAAVDLLAGLTLDSRPDIPGYTFLPVGELPTAIAVPAREGNSMFTYVLSAGSRDVTVLKTRAFRKLAARDQPTQQTVMLPGGSRDAPMDMVLSPNEDALFVTMPDTGRLLRLPIQRCGAGAAEDCVDGEIDPAGISEVSLAQSIERAVPPADDMMSVESYAKTCEYPGPIVRRTIPVPPLSDDTSSLVPKPAGLALDNFCERDQPCRQRLFVADASLPLIHVVDLAAWTGEPTDAAVQAPILTGAPTSAVAVTPRVPVSLSPDAGETQYVYGIDARDGSVLVTENGQLLEVGTFGGRPDRITLASGVSLPVAVSLSVLTPAFDVNGPAAQYAVESAGSNLPKPADGNFCLDSAHAVRSNLRLRGVFLAVGVGDGSVRVIDVHDMDLAECRSCEKQRSDCTCPDPDDASCEECEAQTWDPYPVVRHRTRIAATVLPNADRVSLVPSSQPAFVIDGDLISVRVTGTTSEPRLNGLECVLCGDGQAAAYPSESTSGTLPDAATGGDDAGVDEGRAETDPCLAGSARVCALADPWAELDDWIASWEGALPGSRGGEGRLTSSEDGAELVSPGRFCGLGVQGSEQLRDEAGDARAGDRVVILSDLPPDSAIRNAAPNGGDAFEDSVVEACKSMVRERDRDEDAVPIELEIREAFDDRLVLSPNLVTRRTGLPSEFANEAEFVNKCFGNTQLTYELRAGDAYLVVGRNNAGFLHRVEAEEGSGRCVVDETQDAKRNGRAYENERFDNGRVAFQIRNGLPERDTALLLRLGSNTPKTVVNASVSVNDQVIAAIPTDLRWSTADNVLYMVDIASRGLLQIPVDLFPTSGISRDFQ
jgi:hypothetical protein